MARARVSRHGAAGVRDGEAHARRGARASPRGGVWAALGRRPRPRAVSRLQPGGSCSLLGGSCLLADAGPEGGWPRLAPRLRLSPVASGPGLSGPVVPPCPGSLLCCAFEQKWTWGPGASPAQVHTALEGLWGQAGGAGAGRLPPVAAGADTQAVWKGVGRLPWVKGPCWTHTRATPPHPCLSPAPALALSRDLAALVSADRKNSPSLS